MNHRFSAEIPSPCYVLEEEKLVKNLELLHHVEKKAGVSILCALKGYAMWSTFPLLAKYISGATASSLFEAKLIQEEWEAKAHLCCPVYLEKDFEEITNISSHITFNSVNQFERFGEKAVTKGLSCGLRINPEYSEIDIDLYNPASPNSRLGIRRQDLIELPKGVEGLHVHVLCENNADTLVRMLHVLEHKFESELHQVKWVNLGGGHHITREDYDVVLLVQTLKEFKQKYQVEIFLEPGEAIGWQTGYLLSTVQDIVKGQDVDTAILDVSFTAHMPDCLEMPYKPDVTVNHNGDCEIYRLGGLSCLAGDYLGDYELPRLKVGDKVIFEDMIHYTMVKTTMFNGVNLPNIGVLNQNNFTLLKQFTFKNYKNRLS